MDAAGANGHERDPPRLLALYSEHGYTDNRLRALSEEPEAVPASYQRRVSEERRRRDRQRRLDAFVATVGYAVVATVRTIQRSTERLGRTL